MSIAKLRRYRKYSEKLEQKSRELDRWAMLMPVGQPFPSFERAALKHAYSYEKQLSPVWEKIRHRIDITRSGKTLWQHFPFATKEFPPLYKEIRPLLKSSTIQAIEGKTQVRRLRQNQSGIIYIIATIIVFLFLIGLTAFTLWSIMASISTALTPLTNSYHNSTWPLYDALDYAETFMDSFWQYLLAIAFFGLAFWVYMYSQHRGQPYY